MTFGAQCGKELTCEVVRIRMKLRDDQNQELQLFVVPQICEPLTAQPINICTEEFEHLLNQAHACFLKIDPVRIVGMLACMRVCLCVCMSTPEAINN